MPSLSSLESILKLTDELILDATAVRHALSLGPRLRKPDSDPSQRHPTSLVLRTAALGFYESTILLPLELDLPVVILPSPAFTYLCLLSNELMSVSRICGIVARCARSSSLVAPRPESADAFTPPARRLREALTGTDSAIVKLQDGAALDPGSDAIEALNTQLVSLVNALWLRRFLAGDGSMGLSSCVHSH